MTHIRVADHAGDFAGDKDVARLIRQEMLQPELLAGNEVVVSFEGVDLATQSFIHAMISDLVRSAEFDALDLLVFEHCNESVKELISIVVEYSQEDVAPDMESGAEVPQAATPESTEESAS